MSGICAFTRDRKRVFAHPRRLRGRCHPLAPHFCAVPRAVTPINGRSVRVHHFQSGHPQQIVSSSYKVAPRLCSFSTPIPGASQPTHRLHPSKDFSAIPEAEKFDRFLSGSEGISQLISNRDLGFSHDSTPALVSTFSSGVSAVP